MSKIALTPNASGTGTLTIAAPNTSTDRTLTLPDSTGTVDTLQRAGNVIQVVQATTSTQTVGASSSFFDTTLQGSITPSSSSNKILITVNLAGTGVSGLSSATDRVHYRILRDASEIHYWEKINGYTNSSVAMANSVSTTKLDSPSTTSSVTYKVQMHGHSSEQVIAQWQSGISTITLMEIAA